MPKTFSFEEAVAPKTFSFEEATAPKTFSFEDAVEPRPSAAEALQPPVSSFASEIGSGDPRRVMNAQLGLLNKTRNLTDIGLASSVMTPKETSLTDQLQAPQSIPTSSEQLGARNSQGADVLRQEVPGYTGSMSEGVNPDTGLMTELGIDPSKLATGEEIIKATGAHPSIAYPLSAAGKTFSGVLDFMTSPSGLVQMIAAALPGTDLVMAGKFAKDMIHGGYIAAKDVGEGLAQGDWQKVSEGISNYAANAFGAKAVIGHGVKTARNRAGVVDVPQIETPGEAGQRAALIAKGEPTQFQRFAAGDVKPSEAAPSPPSASSTPTPPAAASAGAGSSAVVTADTVLKRGAGETSHTDIGSMSDAEILKLTEAKKEGGGVAYPPNGDSTVWGAKQGPEMVPVLEKLKAEAGKKMMAAQMKEMALSNDKSASAQDISAAGRAFKAEYFRKLWYDTALEGAKRSGPNYERAMADGRIKAGEASTPAPAAETPAAPPEPGRINPLEMTPEKAAGDVVSWLESKKIKGDYGVSGANPFPQIGTALWNTGIDVAIGAVKAGRSLRVGIEEAIDHIGKNFKGEFNEEALRKHLLSELTPPKERQTGMGAATMEEVSPQGAGLKNETGRMERVLHGLPEEYRTVARSMPEVFLEADEILKADPKAGEKLAAELKINPERGMTDTDSALLLRHKVALENAKNEAASDTLKAETPTEKAEAQARFDGLSQELLDLLDAAKFRGSQWGREGRWRQALAFDDYSLETMKRDKKLSLDRDLTPEENAQIQKLHERITELETQLAGKEKSTKQTQRGKVMDETIAETGKRAKAKGVERDLAGEETDAINHLKERFTEQGDLTGAGTTIKNLMELLYRKGHTERISLENAVHDILKKQVDPTIQLEEVQDLMSGYGKYTEPSKDPVKAGVREVQGQILQVKKMLDIVRQGFAKPTGFLRQQAGQVQRNLQKAVNELKKQYGIPQDAAKSLQSALDSVKTRLRNRILDIKQELANKEKIISKRSPAPSDAETIKLRQELDELQKQRDEMFPKEPITPEEQLKRLEASADRQIKELERQIKSGRIFPESKQTSNLTSERLSAARAKIEALKQERDAMRETIQPTAEPEVVQLQQLLNRLRNREVEYKDRLAKGDFGKRVRKEPPTSPEVLLARARVEQAKNEFNKGLHADRMAKRTTGQKIWDGIKRTRGAIVNIASSFDFSAPRQALTAILANTTRLITSPVKGAKLLATPSGRMFKAFASETSARVIEQRIKDRPNAKSGADKKAGIEYTELETNKFTRHEENAHSVLDEWAELPLRTGNLAKTTITAAPKLASRAIRMSNRGFITFLNSTRAGLFDFLLENKFKDRAPTDLELKLIGHMVNVTTGRGSLKPTTAQAASEILWAPKLLTARLQLLSGQPLWTGKWAESGRARRIVAEEYARIIAGGFVLWSVSRMFDEKDEKSPTSSDFGKVVRGNVRIDPWGGLQQVTVLGARSTTATTTTLKGKEQDIGAAKKYGQRGIWYVWSDFVRSKLRPDIGAAVDAITRSDVIGRPTTPSSVAQSVLVPLPMRDVTSILKDRGFTEGMIIEALGQFGAGVSSYEPTKPKK